MVVYIRDGFFEREFFFCRFLLAGYIDLGHSFEAFFESFETIEDILFLIDFCGSTMIQGGILEEHRILLTLKGIEDAS